MTPIFGELKGLATMNDASRPKAAHAQCKNRSAPRGGPATAQLLDDIRSFVRRYVLLADEQAVAIALWVAHTHAFDAAHATPYLAVGSAEKRSGKTRLIEVLALLVRRPWRAAGASEAAVFRKIAAECPTLLLDEVDAIFGSNTARSEPLRAVLNAGNRPGDAVARVVGEGSSMRVEDFPVYGPKLLAGIDTGSLPDTITDRSITIGLKRKMSREHVERFYKRDAAPAAEPLREALARWATEHVDWLGAARPDLPEALNDRAAEAWEPLLAVADLASGAWSLLAREAAAELSGGEDLPRASDGTRLLGAIRHAFKNRTSLSTDELLAALNDDDELPFGGMRNYQGLDARGLARRLRPFDIRPRTVRVLDKTPKGYARSDFEEEWERYLPRLPKTPPQPPQPPQPPREHGSGIRVDGDVADVAHVAHEERVRPDAEARLPSCPYRGHRGSDWLTGDGRWECGICHPPADPSIAAGWRQEAV